MSRVRTFVLCPPRHVTGGTEALHQLVHKATELGFEADIVYGPEQVNDPAPPAFAHYSVSRVEHVDDSPTSLVVVPEVDAPALATVVNAQRALWWLSVDNFESRAARARAHGTTTVWDQVVDPTYGITHLSQSAYAVGHLANRGVQSPLLTDYLHGDSIERLTGLGRGPKDDIVVYNPAKGLDITHRLMELTPHLAWVPLEGLDREGADALLGRSKVYVDFGNHPGRDRIPREAVVAGNCIVVARRGSAANPADVPVPDEYRITLDEDFQARAVRLIEQCLLDHDRRRRAFSSYQLAVRAQENTFTDEVFSLLATASSRVYRGSDIRVR